jgi:hypothetical protein
MGKDKFKQDLAERKIRACTKILKACKERDVCPGLLSILSGLSEEFVCKIGSHSVLPSERDLLAISLALGIPKEELETK